MLPRTGWLAPVRRSRRARDGDLYHLALRADPSLHRRGVEPFETLAAGRGVGQGERRAGGKGPAGLCILALWSRASRSDGGIRGWPHEV